MASKSFRFTPTRIRNLINTTGKDEEYKDTDQKGLILRLSKNNRKVFRLKAWNRRKKKTEQIVLGVFPDLSIIAAKEEVNILLANMSKGIDVTNLRRKEREEQTLQEIFTIWLEEHAKINNRRWEQDQSRYNLYIRPHLGTIKLSNLTPDVVRRWQLKLTQYKKQRGGQPLTKSTIQRAHIVLSSIFSKAAPQIPNPCSQVKKYTPPRRTKFMQPEDLSRFFRALEQPETPEYLRDYLLLSLYTGARRSSILSMRWNHVDFVLNLWIIPASETKNDEPQVVPLLDQAIAILRERKKNTASLFVFPTPRKSKTGHFVEPKKAWKSLLLRAGLSTNYRLHDIRRTMGSWQAITGASTKIIGASLGHKTEQATSHYAHLTIEPIRASMQKAANEMDKYKGYHKIKQFIKK